MNKKNLQEKIHRLNTPAPQQFCKIQNLLLLVLNRLPTTEAEKMFFGKVDKEMYQWLRSKAEGCLKTHDDVASAWIHFLSNLDAKNLAIAVEYINERYSG